MPTPDAYLLTQPKWVFQYPRHTKYVIMTKELVIREIRKAGAIEIHG